jgi:hypothetical protein
MNATLLILAILFVGCTPPPLKPHVSAAAAEAKVSVALMETHARNAQDRRHVDG